MSRIWCVLSHLKVKPSTPDVGRSLMNNTSMNLKNERANEYIANKRNSVWGLMAEELSYWRPVYEWLRMVLSEGKLPLSQISSLLHILNNNHKWCSQEESIIQQLHSYVTATICNMRKIQAIMLYYYHYSVPSLSDTFRCLSPFSSSCSCHKALVKLLLNMLLFSLSKGSAEDSVEPSKMLSLHACTQCVDARGVVWCVRFYSNCPYALQVILGRYSSSTYTAFTILLGSV